MHHEFTAIIEPPTDDDPWWIAACAEVPGANGQGETEEAAIENLREAIQLILETNREQQMRGVPDNARSRLVTLE